jgi:hypothetical protein
LFGFLRRLTEPFRCRQVVIQRTPLDDLADAKYPVITVPFYGTLVPVKLRELTQVQVRACGDFSLIKTFEDKVRSMSRSPNMREINAYASRYHRLAEASLVAPTYDEIMGLFESDQTVKDAQAKLDELQATLQETPKGPKRAAIEEEIESTRVWCELLLPMDFLSAVMSYALGLDRSDIQEVSDEALLEAAMLADRGRDNPADHMDGRFTSFMKDDINRRGWMALQKWRETHKPKSGPKKKAVFSGR